MKSCTDIEQSKKLAEILSLESADMNYNNMCTKGVMYSNPFSAGLSHYEVAVKMNKENIDFYIGDSGYKGVIAWEILPCWSLAALLAAIPIEHVLHGYLTENGKVYRIETLYAGNSKSYSNPIDACVDMIVELHKQNVL